MTPPAHRRLLLQLVALVVAGWLAALILRAAQPIGREVGDNPTARELLADRDLPSQRVAAPTLTLVVVTDYLCPACKGADAALHAAAARDGHVRIAYLDWPVFGPPAERAARVALAADRQGIYPALHRRLMAEQRMPTDAVLREAVEASGGSWPRILADLRAHGVAIDRRLAANRVAAFALGITGTPAYLAGPVLVLGAADERGFARLFEEGRAAGRY